MPTQAQNPRVLVFSQRNASERLPFRCAHFEFEDVIAEVDAVEMLAPRFDVSTRLYSRAKQLAYHTPLVLNPGLPRPKFDRTYDLFVAVCGDPTDMLHIQALGDWRQKCRKAICIIDEIWVTQMDRYANYLRLLKQFDSVFLYYSQSVEPLNQRIGPRAVYLPPAVDTARFTPYPHPPQRVVDVYSIGRRSATTHQALLQMAADRSIFYIHDTTSADHVPDPVEHRNLYASIVKRSRYFIVNPGLIDRPDIRGNQIEIGYRYFDAIASGTIMIGERADNAVFPQLFDWPDALLYLPYNSPDIGAVMQELDRDPEKQARMRRTGAEQALLRHDWVHRWETILAQVGLDPLPALAERKTRLRNLAASAAQDVSVPLTAHR